MYINTVVGNNSLSGLERIALDLMGINEWRKLFTDINCLENSNNEPKDWKADEACTLCNSTQTDQSNTIQNSEQILDASSPIDSLVPVFNPNSTMTTTPLIMTNTNCSLTNDSDHLNSFKALISADNMANQNVTNDLTEINKVENYQHTSDCHLKNYSNIFNQTKLNCTCMSNTDEPIDLDNSSIKSETLSNDESNTIAEQKMVINEQKPQLNSLANLLTSNILNQSETKTNSDLIEQMIDQLNQKANFNCLTNSLMMNNQTGEQPLDLSVRPKDGSSELMDLSFLTSLCQYANESSLAGKMKKNKIDGVKKRSYTEDQLGKALDDVKSGRLGTRRAAALYNIPRSTLRNKVHKIKNLEGKKTINQLAPTLLTNNTTTKTNECDNETKYSQQSTSDQTLLPASDSLRELLKKNICSKSAESPVDKNSLLLNSLDNNNLQNLEFQHLLANLTSLNNNNLHDNLGLNNNLNDTFNLLNQQTNLESLLTLYNYVNLIRNQDLNQPFQPRSDEQLSNDNNLDESLNSVQSSNSCASIKFNNHSLDKTPNNDDDETSSLSKYDKTSKQSNNLEQSNDHQSEESNLSLNTLENQLNQNNSLNQDLLTKQQRTSNLDESHNSNQSLNLNNPFLLNLSALSNLANPLNNLSNTLNSLANPLNLAGLTNLGDLGNLNNLNFSLIDQTKQNNQNLNNDSSSNNIDPNRKRPKRGRYRNYNKSDLDLAVKSVQRGEMSVHRAGTLYGVPHSTLEYKVKERHLLRPSKRLKKQQMNAALQAAQAAQQAANLNKELDKSLDPINRPSCSTNSDTNSNDLSTAAKLKSALIGNSKFNQNSFDISSLQPLLQQSLLQSASDTVSNLQQTNLTTASDLIKKLQENEEFSNEYF